jgi:hypothetical protein
MSKGMAVIVRVCGWLSLVVALVSLLGRDSQDNLVDKASVYLAPFLAHFAVLARFGPGATSIQQGIGSTIARWAAGILGGLIGGYVLWNALLYVVVALHGGRFDLRASWGTLLLAGGLFYLLSSPPQRRQAAAQPSGSFS